LNQVGCKIVKNRVPPPLWMVLTGALMWLVDRVTPAFHFSVPYLVETRTLVTLVGVAFVVVAIIQFAKLKTTVNPLEPHKSTSLSTDGVYRITRNPMYLGLAIMLLGWGIHLGNPLNLLCITGFMVLITKWQIKPEEAALRDLFGKEFDDYCRRVRRWI